MKDIKAAEKDLAIVEEKDSVKEDPQWTLSVTRDRHVEKEDLAEYIAKKREMFLVQYSLGVKRLDFFGRNNNHNEKKTHQNSRKKT